MRPWREFSRQAEWSGKNWGFGGQRAGGLVWPPFENFMILVQLINPTRLQANFTFKLKITRIKGDDA